VCIYVSFQRYFKVLLSVISSVLSVRDADASLEVTKWKIGGGGGLTRTSDLEFSCRLAVFVQ
jgi:hypothetical protein